MKLKVFLPIFFLLLIASILFIIKTKFSPQSINKTPTVTNSIQKPEGKDIEIIANNLSIPWELAFLPNGDMLVSQRGGKILKIGKSVKTIQEISGVKHIGEGGLLGLALHPNFKTNGFLYLYLTTDSNGQITNRVERYKFTNDKLSNRQIIIEGIKGSSNHDGGRIAFGPDEYLYIGTGDAEVPNTAQDTNALTGKILRIKDDGSIPADNPFGNAVYSLGHRNVQGLTWDNHGNLWTTEHGPSGVQTGNDELNKIEKGGNYGWPTIKGTQTQNGLITPVLESGTKATWAPSGMTYYNNSLFFVGLRGAALYQAKINENSLSLSEHFKNEYGRLRTVVLGPDNYLYLLTNNTDGRGTPKEGDDKIIKVNPDIFSQ